MSLAAAEPLPVAYLPGASGRGSVWQPIATRLAKRRPPILCDYPRDCLSRIVGDVSAMLPARSDWVALSAGAAVALKLAIEQPARVRRLVLVSAAAGVDVRSLGALDFSEAFRSAHPAAPAWFAEAGADVGERLAEIQTETLLVFGERDPIAPLAVGEFLASRLPKARLEVIARATHDLEREEPDLLASLIEAHLRR